MGMSNELAKVEPAVITFDFPTAQQILDQMLEPWKGMTSQDADSLDMKTVKASRAELNKMKRQLEDARKAVKKSVNEPYESFAAQLKSFTDTIDFYVKILDDSIKVRENRLKEDRRAMLSQDYRDFAPMIASIIPFDRILEPQWLNKTYGMRKAQEEMYDKVSNIMQEYDTLRDMEGSLEFYLEDKAVFVETLSLKEALANENARKESAKKIRELESYHDAYSGSESEVDERYYNLTVCCAPEVIREFTERRDVAVIKMEEVSHV